MAEKMPTQKDIEDWLCFMSQEEVDEALGTLQLANTGSRLNKISRLQNWLQGNYTAADFEKSDMPEHAARRQRIEKRIQFIESTCMDRSGSTIFSGVYDREMPHPSSLFLNTVVEIPEEQENEREIDHNEPVMDPLHGIVQQLVQQMSELVRKQDELTNYVHDTTRALYQNAAPAASSTQVDSQDASHRNATLNSTAHEQSRNERTRVNFQDTFTAHYFNTSSPACNRASAQFGANSTAAPRPPPARQAWGRGEITPEGSATAMANALTAAGHARDSGQVVKRWGISFSGDSSLSIDAFLQKVQDARATANLSEAELLASLAFLFTGDGELWYRWHKNKWQTWEGFCQIARRRWGSRHDLQERLRLEIIQRFQQNDEPVRLYITRIEAMLLQLEPQPTEMQQVEQIFENLLPQIKRLVQKANCLTVDDLVEAAASAESTLEKEKRYRTPIPPSCSVVLEAAYRPPPKK